MLIAIIAVKSDSVAVVSVGKMATPVVFMTSLKGTAVFQGIHSQSE